MRNLSRSVLVLLPLALAACASSQPLAQSSPAAERYQRDNLIRDDADYIARVNEEALRRGLLVQWINPPTKRTRTASVD